MNTDRTLFIADLHLDPARPACLELARRFLADARHCKALYIVGDLFEYWLGDDAVDPTMTPIIDAIGELAAAGSSVTLMHGNRDFLLGDAFAARIGARLERADEIVLEIEGEHILLMHGDTLCTDDVDYQKLRALLRSESWQSGFLEKSIEERIETAQELRSRSRSAVAEKAAVGGGAGQGIMDVNADRVASRLRESDCTTLLHGHTHRPAEHRIDVEGVARRRLVMGDWHDDHAIYALHDGERLELQTYR